MGTGKDITIGRIKDRGAAGGGRRAWHDRDHSS